MKAKSDKGKKASIKKPAKNTPKSSGRKHKDPDEDLDDEDLDEDLDDLDFDLDEELEALDDEE